MPNELVSEGTIGEAWWTVHTAFCRGWFVWTAGRRGREDRRWGLATKSREEAEEQAQAAARIMAGVR